MKAKTKYELRFFKNEMHEDSYERQVTEQEVFIFFSICRRYTVKEEGNKKFSLTMIFNDDTFIKLKEATYPIFIRLLGAKNFEKAYLKSQKKRKK